MKLDHNRLDREPINIGDGAWAYEERNGIDIYFELTKARSNPTTHIGKISLKRLRSYLKRVDSPRAK